MENGRVRLRGTTLAELLVAVVLLAACTSVILATVTSAATRAGYAQRRAVIAASLLTQIDQARLVARAYDSGTKPTDLAARLTGAPWTAPLSLSLPGNVGVSVSGTCVLTPGFTAPTNSNPTLYSVTVTATWKETSFANSRTDTMKLATYVRYPDV